MRLVAEKMIETKDHTLSLSLSPTGHLYLYKDVEVVGILSKTLIDTLGSFFAIDGSLGLLRLGLSQFSEPLPPSFVFWQQFARLFITEMCKQGEFNKKGQFSAVRFPVVELSEWITQAPFVRGIEYLNLDTARILWQGLMTAISTEVETFGGSLNQYLSVYHSVWNTVGKVCFHLAENKANRHYPFAFLATYTTGLSKKANTEHLPLGKALEEYAVQSKKHLLLPLLLPIHKAAENSIFLKNLVDTGQIFKPLAWEAKEAYQFLKDIPQFESAGLMTRVPNWWNVNKPPRPKIQIKVGNQNNKQIGLNALLDFELQFCLPTGETLTQQEFKHLLNSTETLIQIKGQWVQVDNEKLDAVLSHWKSIERRVKKEGLSFSEGLRLISGVSQNEMVEAGLPEAITAWSTVIEGDWLHTTLTRLRHPEDHHENNIQNILQQSLQAVLRAYQARGVEWLWWLYNMRLGGCLADDMGLGKTIQMIALLLLVKHQVRKHKTHLLILPTSLLANWQAEINRFAPLLSLWVAHSSNVREDKMPDLAKIDVVLTTYGTLHRVSWLGETAWDMVILDEAQAIKNPGAKQTQAIKALNTQVRFVLTGTPIENRLLDLWSLFDFVAPGLLGSSRVFANYSKQKSKAGGAEYAKGQFYAAIRRLVNPYILRRLKSDKNIISDLPDKIEMQTYCYLTKQQISLYQRSVNDLKIKLEQTDGIKRRGVVMSYLLAFKQICNHPHQWLGHGEYEHELSGKFLRLRELCEVIADKQEKVLVFTQFREIIPALCTFLSIIFKCEGLFLDGQTTVKERAKRVERFQEDQGPPFFVLSLKAGGTGLNLTAASHVIHFDRWWNPAVENQATDRAFRIGQKKNVLVHKFICQGTIEEKIDGLLNAKKNLVNEIIGQENEIAITELSDVELMNIVTLDIHRAIEEN